MKGIAPACIKYVPPLMRLMPAHSLATRKLMGLGIPFTFARYAITDAVSNLSPKELQRLSSETKEKQAINIAHRSVAQIFQEHNACSERYREAMHYLEGLESCGEKLRYLRLKEHRTLLYGFHELVIRAPRGFQARRMAQRSAFGYFTTHTQKRHSMSMLISDYAFYRRVLENTGTEGQVDETALSLSMDGHFEDDAVTREYITAITELSEFLRYERIKKTPLPVLSAAIMLDIHGTIEAALIAERFAENFSRARKYLKGQGINADTAYDISLDVFGVDEWLLQKEILDLKRSGRSKCKGCGEALKSKPKKCSSVSRKKDTPSVTQYLRSAQVYFRHDVGIPPLYVCLANHMPALFGPMTV
jgi:hypothetical protein